MKTFLRIEGLNPYTDLDTIKRLLHRHCNVPASCVMPCLDGESNNVLVEAFSDAEADNIILKIDGLVLERYVLSVHRIAHTTYHDREPSNIYGHEAYDQRQPTSPLWQPTQMVSYPDNYYRQSYLPPAEKAEEKNLYSSQEYSHTSSRHDDFNVESSKYRTLARERRERSPDVTLCDDFDIAISKPNTLIDLTGNECGRDYFDIPQLQQVKTSRHHRHRKDRKSPERLKRSRSHDKLRDRIRSRSQSRERHYDARPTTHSSSHSRKEELSDGDRRRRDDRSRRRSHERKLDRSNGRSRDRSYGRSRDRSNGRSRDRSYGRSRDSRHDRYDRRDKASHHKRKSDDKASDRDKSPELKKPKIEPPMNTELLIKTLNLTDEQLTKLAQLQMAYVSQEQQTQPTKQTIENNEPTKHEIANNQPIKQAIENNQPIKQAIANNQPMKQAIANNEPTKQAIANTKFTKQGIANNQPIKLAIANNQPSKQAIANSQPTKQAITNNQPTKQAITNNQPTRQAIANSQPTKQAIDNNQPIKQAIDNNQPIKQTIVKNQPTKQAIVNNQPTKQAIANKQPTKQTIANNQPTKQAIVNNQPTKQAIVNNQPTKQAIANKQPTKQAIAKNQAPMLTIDLTVDATDKQPEAVTQRNKRSQIKETVGKCIIKCKPVSEMKSPNTEKRAFDFNTVCNPPVCDRYCYNYRGHHYTLTRKQWVARHNAVIYLRTQMKKYSNIKVLAIKNKKIVSDFGMCMAAAIRARMEKILLGSNPPKKNCFHFFLTSYTLKHPEHTNEEFFKSVWQTFERYNKNVNFEPTEDEAARFICENGTASLEHKSGTPGSAGQTGTDENDNKWARLLDRLVSRAQNSKLMGSVKLITNKMVTNSKEVSTTMMKYPGLKFCLYHSILERLVKISLSNSPKLHRAPSNEIVKIYRNSFKETTDEHFFRESLAIFKPPTPAKVINDNDLIEEDIKIIDDILMEIAENNKAEECNNEVNNALPDRADQNIHNDKSNNQAPMPGTSTQNNFIAQPIVTVGDSCQDPSLSGEVTSVIESMERETSFNQRTTPGQSNQNEFIDESCNQVAMPQPSNHNNFGDPNFNGDTFDPTIIANSVDNPIVNAQPLEPLGQPNFGDPNINGEFNPTLFANSIMNPNAIPQPSEPPLQPNFGDPNFNPDANPPPFDVNNINNPNFNVEAFLPSLFAANIGNPNFNIEAFPPTLFAANMGNPDFNPPQIETIDLTQPLISEELIRLSQKNAKKSGSWSNLFKNNFETFRAGTPYSLKQFNRRMTAAQDLASKLTAFPYVKEAFAQCPEFRKCVTYCIRERIEMLFGNNNDVVMFEIQSVYHIRFPPDSSEAFVWSCRKIFEETLRASETSWNHISELLPTPFKSAIKAVLPEKQTAGGKSKKKQKLEPEAEQLLDAEMSEIAQIIKDYTEETKGYSAFDFDTMKVIKRQIPQIINNLKRYTTKRFLGVSDELYVRLIGHPTTTKAQVKQFINKYNPTSMIQCNKMKYTFIARLKSHEDYDKLVALKSVKIGGRTVAIKSHQVPYFKHE